MAEAAPETAVCVERVRRHDEEAAQLLLQRLYPLVIKIVRAHLPRRTSEEDLAQLIFMKIFSKLDQYSGAVPLEHWVSRIAVNTCLNQLQSEKARPELRWADLTEDEEKVLHTIKSTADEVHPAEALAARELTEKILAHLNSDDRLVLTLLYLEGLSVQEIGDMTGWGHSWIKVRAFRARQRLKKQFKELLKNELL